MAVIDLGVKECRLCGQQFSLEEASGAVCMDCEFYNEQSGVRVCQRCKVPLAPDERPQRKRCRDCGDKTTPVLPYRRCPQCSISFMPTRRAQVNCSNKCAQRAYKKASRKPEPWDERRKANYQKRRARKLQLPADSIRPLDVFERDAWICGLCGDPVPEGVAWPDPLSASLDHVVPLSRGGHHVLENVQLAHLSCNVQKGARTP